jgi:hypothetical protein
MADERATELPELEIPCPVCGGAGGDTERRQWSPCYRCDGAGYFPTEAGRRVLALMRHNFRPMQEDIRGG